MLKKIFLLVILLNCLQVEQGLANDFLWFKTFTKEWKKSGSTDFLEGRISAAVLDSLDVIYEKAPHSYFFYEFEGVMYAIVTCTFDLYRIEGDELVKMYLYFNRGYTCSATPLVIEGRHYLIGGHGFWMNQMDLLVFDEIHGSWEWTRVKNQPLDYFSSFVYPTSKGIVSLFGSYYNPRNQTDAEEKQGYFLEWESKTWKNVSIAIEGIDNAILVDKGGFQFVHTQDYVFFVSSSGLKNIGWNIIEKESGLIYFYDSKNSYMITSPVLEIIGNRLHYFSPGGEAMQLDLDFIKANSKQVGKVQVGPSNAAPNHFFNYAPLNVLGGVLVGGVLLFLALRYRKRKNTKLEEEENVPLLYSPVDILLPYAGQLLTTETLDHLLGIDANMKFDSRRMKRARLINEINKLYLAQVGKELVQRDKKPEDRRFVYYKIQA